MLLTISTTHTPATDLGYLLHKNPANVQVFELTFGKAHIFYPEATEQRCTLALLLDVDPVGLVRGKNRRSGGPLAPYVNDRVYAASSFLSVAISRVLGTALAGRSKERPELAQEAIPLEAKVCGVPCRGGDPVLRRLFEPLGYRVSARRYELDPEFPGWGPGPYATIEIAGRCRLAELLTHLYVLIPVLDDEKHYFVGGDEVDKLLDKGEGWLATHPERELITYRYLKHRRSLAREALARLIPEEEAAASEAGGDSPGEEEIEQPLKLNEQRINTVLAALRVVQPRSVLDLGCGEGKLLRELIKDPTIDRVVGADVSIRALEIAHRRLRVEQMPSRQTERLELVQTALTYRDRRLSGFDAAAVVEVIEHLDPDRLSAFERVVFEHARPGRVVLTTPNREYNAHFEKLSPAELRHRDHRFEWTRQEFQAWATATAARHRYRVRFGPIGPEHPQTGSPTQMAIFDVESGGGAAAAS